MKTTIKFDILFTAMLAANGNDPDQVINACQSEANSAKGREGGSKRGDFRGGHSYRADGTLVIKPIGFKEQTTTDYEIAVNGGKVPAPAELVKFHDSLLRHWKQTGRPTGELPPAMLPAHLKLWLDMTCRAKAGSKAKDDGKAVAVPATVAKRNGNLEEVEVATD